MSHLKFSNHVIYCWLRSLISASKIGRKVERVIISRRAPTQTMCADGYVGVVAKILGELYELNSTSPQESTVFEIGTGRHLAVPIMLRALGIKRVITVDVADGLILSQAKAMAMNISQNRLVFQLAQSFGISLPIINWKIIYSAQTIDEFLSALGIEVFHSVRLDDAIICDRIIPAETNLIFSMNVLEHIHPDNLKKILFNCQSSLSNAKKSIQLHHVDLSDHFSHEIPSLHPLNFYRFSEFSWKCFSRNTYAYTNRQTINDYKLLAQGISNSTEIEVLEQVDLSKWPSAHLFCNKYFAGNQLDILKIYIKLSKY